MPSNLLSIRADEMPRLFYPSGDEVKFSAWKVTPHRSELETFDSPVFGQWRHGLIGYEFAAEGVTDVDGNCVGGRGVWLPRLVAGLGWGSCVWPVFFTMADPLWGRLTVQTNGPPLNFSEEGEPLDRIAEWEATVMADPAAAPAYADWLEENGVAAWRMHRLRGTVGVNGHAK